AAEKPARRKRKSKTEEVAEVVEDAPSDAVAEVETSVEAPEEPAAAEEPAVEAVATVPETEDASVEADVEEIEVLIDESTSDFEVAHREEVREILKNALSMAAGVATKEGASFDLSGGASVRER